MVTTTTARPAGQVAGVLCRDGHFNDPRVKYCSACGVAAAQVTRTPVWDVRPQLGVLVLDTGSVRPLATDLVLGGRPGTDPAVAAGAAGALALAGEHIAGVHARIVLDGWDAVLVDAGSPAGTYVCGREEHRWTRLPRGGSVVLHAGDRISLGSRRLEFHTHRHV